MYYDEWCLNQPKGGTEECCLQINSGGKPQHRAYKTNIQSVIHTEGGIVFVMVQVNGFTEEQCWDYMRCNTLRPSICVKAAH